MRQKVNLLEAFSMSCGFIGFTFIFLNWMNFKLHLHIYTDNRPVLEKILLTVPFMQMVIPLVGTLANIVGMFIASVVCGVIGAIAINRIDKFLAERQKNALVIREIEKKKGLIKKEEILTEVKNYTEK